MSSLANLVRQLGVTPVARAAASAFSTIRAHDEETLRSVLTQLAGRDLRLLEAIALHPDLPAQEPVLVARLFRAAEAIQTSDKARAHVRDLAERAGFGDEFDGVTLSTSVLTPSQEKALELLTAMAEAFFEEALDPRHSPVQLRLNPLLIGPSGVGKTHLVRLLARRLGGLPVLTFTVGNWIVAGAKSENTHQVIARTLEEHERAIVFLDELDALAGGGGKEKIDQNSDWSGSRLAGIMSLLDRTLGSGGIRGEWTDHHSRRLREGVFVIAAGTWQPLWRQLDIRPVGFGGSAGARADITQLIKRAHLLPEELLNRLASPWLVLEPMSENDHRRVAHQLKLGPGIFNPAHAAATGRNFRAIEDALTQHAIQLRLQRRASRLQPKQRLEEIA
jgi:SpoVK/Ycf46/Vps4 family AAA+-type ATPase